MHLCLQMTEMLHAWNVLSMLALQSKPQAAHNYCTSTKSNHDTPGFPAFSILLLFLVKLCHFAAGLPVPTAAILLSHVLGRGEGRRSCHDALGAGGLACQP